MIIPRRLLPCSTVVPPISTSSVAIRVVPQGTGVVKRSSSSTAEAVMDPSSRSRSAWSGWSIRVRIELLMRLAVVSWPASMRRKIMAEVSSGLRASPSSPATTSAVISPSSGEVRRSSAMRSMSLSSLRAVGRTRANS